jgi:competence protein ComEA
MARVLARLLLVVAVMAPAALRPALEAPPPPRACAPEGRGEPPRHWLGCAGDGGAPRPLAAGERLVLGRPVDPNTAPVEVLAHVPGLSAALAREIVRDRTERGPFASVDALERVRGIGPKRLAAARARLAISPTCERSSAGPLHGDHARAGLRCPCCPEAEPP